MDEVTAEINTPWGTLKGEATQRQRVEFFIKQLQYSLDTGSSPDRAYTMRDLMGYRILLREADDNTIGTFFDMKQAGRENGQRYEDNVRLVEDMKVRGLWHVRGVR